MRVSRTELDTPIPGGAQRFIKAAQKAGWWFDVSHVLGDPGTGKFVERTKVSAQAGPLAVVAIWWGGKFRSAFALEAGKFGHKVPAREALAYIQDHPAEPEQAVRDE